MDVAPGRFRLRLACLKRFAEMEWDVVVLRGKSALTRKLEIPAVSLI
jgi:hypothetical protein